MVSGGTIYCTYWNSYWNTGVSSGMSAYLPSNGGSRVTLSAGITIDVSTLSSITVTLAAWNKYNCKAAWSSTILSGNTSSLNNLNSSGRSNSTINASAGTYTISTTYGTTKYNYIIFYTTSAIGITAGNDTGYTITAMTGVKS